MIDPERMKANRTAKIQGLIKSRPGISAAELNEATDSIPQLARDEITKGLIAAGLIRVEVIPTKGRPRKQYWPV